MRTTLKRNRMKQSKRYSFYTTLNYLPYLIHNSSRTVLLLLFATQSSKILQKSAALLSLLSNWKIEKKKKKTKRYSKSFANRANLSNKRVNWWKNGKAEDGGRDSSSRGIDIVFFERAINRSRSPRYPKKGGREGGGKVDLIGGLRGYEFRPARFDCSSPGWLERNDICAAINRRLARFSDNVSEPGVRWSNNAPLGAQKMRGIVRRCSILPSSDQDRDDLSRGEIRSRSVDRHC